MFDTEMLFPAFLLLVAIAFAVYNRFSLRYYNYRTGDLPEGVVVCILCKGTTLIHILSDGEGYSKPKIIEKESAACGFADYQ